MTDWCQAWQSRPFQCCVNKVKVAHFTFLIDMKDVKIERHEASRADFGMEKF